MSDTERRVRAEVCRVVANVSNWPTPVGAQMLGCDLAEPIDKITEALLPIVREVKADAWDEGMEAAQRAASLRTYTPDNPFREEP